MNEIEQLLMDYDPDATGKTYAQLAEEHPDIAGLQVLASREAERLAQDCCQTERPLRRGGQL